jgi:protein-disulfide isomerase
MDTQSAHPSPVASIFKGIVGAMPAVLLIAILVVAGRHFVGGAGERPKDPEPPTAPQQMDLQTLRGSTDAQVGIIAYSEFECPFCARFAQGVFPKLEEQYISTGKVAFSFKHFPLEQIHPYAVGAARVASCAGAQGRFWALHDRMFEQQGRLDGELPLRLANELGLEQPKLRACLDETAEAKVRSDIDQAKKVGFFSTPSFLVGRLNGDQLSVTSVIIGAQPFEQFSAAIEKVLRQAPVVSN